MRERNSFQYRHWIKSVSHIFRLQPTWMVHLLTTAAKFLVETRQVFTDWVRKPKGKGKGKGAEKGNLQEPGCKGNNGRGKGKAKAPGAMPKMAAGPA